MVTGNAKIVAALFRETSAIGGGDQAALRKTLRRTFDLWISLPYLWLGVFLLIAAVSWYTNSGGLERETMPDDPDFAFVLWLVGINAIVGIRLLAPFLAPMIVFLIFFGRQAPALSLYPGVFGVLGKHLLPALVSLGMVAVLYAIDFPDARTPNADVYYGVAANLHIIWGLWIVWKVRGKFSAAGMAAGMKEGS